MSHDAGFTHFNFTGAGQDTIAVDPDEHISLFQVDFSAFDDMQATIRIGATVIYQGLIKKDFPFQLYFIDFGQGRGTGVKGDSLIVQVGAACNVFLSYKIY